MKKKRKKEWCLGFRSGGSPQLNECRGNTGGERNRSIYFNMIAWFTSAWLRIGLIHSPATQQKTTHFMFSQREVISKIISILTIINVFVCIYVRVCVWECVSKLVSLSWYYCVWLTTVLAWPDSRRTLEEVVANQSRQQMWSEGHCQSNTATY